MNIIIRSIAFVLAMVIFSPSWVLAQGEEQRRASQELRKIMINQELLNANDVRVYLANADAIYRLQFEPDKLQETILATGAWSEQRFIYVTVKMAVGMSQLMNPANFRPQDVSANFAQPTPQEMAVIMEHQDELNRTMERIQERYRPAPTAQP